MPQDLQLTPAPLFEGLACGPAGGSAMWLPTQDGRRLRVCHWPVPARQGKGTVLLFPGRSEYVEKYGLAAAHLVGRGYDVLVIDWRGQGLADRVVGDRMLGHVDDFAEYQLDVQALWQMADQIGAPGPRYLLSHSMGGAIALRALIEGLPVRAAAFSAPMWGVRIAPLLRPIAAPTAATLTRIGAGRRYAPSTGRVNYVMLVPFAGNMLTSDRKMWDWMVGHLRAHPELGLGGPSLAWLDAALRECVALAAQPAPDVPALCAVGGRERIVEVAPIRSRMARWPGGNLVEYPGAEHEVMMEGPAVRDRFLDLCADLFDAHP